MAEQGSPDGRESKTGLPATLRLRGEVDEKITELAPVAAEKHAEVYGEQPAGEGYVYFGEGTPPLPLTVGEVDHVSVESLMRDSDGTTVVGVKLFSDGSPYNLPTDVEDGAEGQVTYDLVAVNGEYPPFIAFAGAVKDGEDGSPDYIEYLRNGGVAHDGTLLDPPLILGEESAQQFINDVLPQLTADSVVAE